MMLRGFSSPVNSDQEVSPCLCYTSLFFVGLLFCHEHFVTWFSQKFFFRSIVYNVLNTVTFSTIFGWSDSKLRKSLWKFGVSKHFFKSFNLWTAKEWVSEIQTCQRVWARQNLTGFFPKMKSNSMHIMIVYSILIFGFALSEIEVKTNIMGYMDQA